MVKCLLIIFFITCQICFSKNINEYIKESLNDVRFEMFDKKEKVLNEFNSFKNLIDDVTIEVEKETDNNSNLKYYCKFDFKGISEMHYEGKMNEILLEKCDSEKLVILSSLLKERYFLIIDYLYYRDISILSDSLLLVYNDMIEVEKRNIDKLDFNIENLVKVEEDYEKLRFELIEFDNKLKNSEFVISESLSKSDSIDFRSNDVISVHEISKVATDFNLKLINESVIADYIEIKKKEIEVEWEIERAKKNRILDSFRFGMDKKNNEDVLSFKLGFNIPFLNNRMNDQIKTKIDHLEKLADLEYDDSSILEQKNKVFLQLDRYIKQYNLLNEFLDKKSESKIFQYNNVDVFSLLSIKGSVLKYKMRKVELYRKILQSYIEFIELSKGLASFPLVNYLSHDFEVLLR
ncbi:MAG: hypothetical protein JXR48_01220 [Candidatus Delongbacteria bacterium]|nr:hypothetical protein [Candidatus Delongbacteria bacterium]MBN2833564.1 hypothetical protein [Candidatus Delongbacteria bacterium]